MIGLYKKDLYLCKKMIIITAATFVVLLTFGILWRCAYDYGNLASFPPEDLEYGKSSSEITFPFLAAFMISVESCFLACNSIELDINNNFSIFAYSTKIKEEEMTQLKLLEILTTFVLGCLSTTLYGVIFGILYGFTNVYKGILMGVEASLVVTCILCVIVPLVYKHKSIKRATLTPSIFFLALIVLFEGGFIVLATIGIEEQFYNFCNRLIAPIKEAGGFGPWVHANRFWIILIHIIVLAAFLAGSYFTTLRQMKRREHICGAS